MPASVHPDSRTVEHPECRTRIVILDCTGGRCTGQTSSDRRGDRATDEPEANDRRRRVGPMRVGLRDVASCPWMITSRRSAGQVRGSPERQGKPSSTWRCAPASSARYSAKSTPNIQYQRSRNMIHPVSRAPAADRSNRRSSAPRENRRRRPVPIGQGHQRLRGLPRSAASAGQSWWSSCRPFTSTKQIRPAGRVDDEVEALELGVFETQRLLRLVHRDVWDAALVAQIFLRRRLRNGRCGRPLRCDANDTGQRLSRAIRNCRQSTSRHAPCDSMPKSFGSSSSSALRSLSPTSVKPSSASESVLPASGHPRYMITDGPEA